MCNSKYIIKSDVINMRCDLPSLFPAACCGVWCTVGTWICPVGVRVSVCAFVSTDNRESTVGCVPIISRVSVKIRKIEI